MLAALMDFCDGRCARALGVSSHLGAELDSLADAISFCVAPCVLLYSWYPDPIGYTGFGALALYLCAGLYRLARFNIIASTQSEYYTGLSVPVAAFFVSSLVLYQQWIVEHSVWFILYKRVPFLIVLFIALLMISQIPFAALKQKATSSGGLRRHNKKRYLLLFAGWVLMLYLFMHGYPLLLIGLTIYILGNIVRWLYLRTQNGSFFCLY
jgi:CDP-diacylglycerol--serine O-phosphatidyltransferase